MYIARGVPTCIPAAEYVYCSRRRRKVIFMSLQGASRNGISLLDFYFKNVQFLTDSKHSWFVLSREFTGIQIEILKLSLA